MKTIVKGMNIELHYVIRDCKREDGIFYHRPYMESDNKQRKKTWETILEYEGTPQYDEGVILDKFYISENEEVIITKKYFRADLGVWIVETDKVLSEKHIGEKKCKQELAKLIKEYNKQKIESCDYLKAYCDIHKLSYEDTDYDELKEIIDKPKSHDDRYLDGYWSDFLGRSNYVVPPENFKPDQATLNEVLTKSTLNSVFGDSLNCTCVNYEGIKDED